MYTPEAKPSLTFTELRAGNIARLPVFKNRKGEPAHTEPDGSDWSLLEWCGAAAGELGELANLAKKVRRGDVGLDDLIDEGNGHMLTVRAWIAKECADVACYLDIIALQAGADLGEATREKFNEVSDRVGCTVKL